MMYALGMGTSRAPLQPGQSSIDRVPPRPHRGGYALDWTLKLYDGSTVRKRTQGRTKGEVRARAREAARELLATGQGAEWKTSDDIGAFIEQISRPMIAESPSLRDSTKARYLQPLDLILGRCDRHPHKAALAGMPIVTAGTYRRLLDCLQDIAKTHGAGTARHARAVLARYVLRPLVREGVLSGNPLAGERLDLDRSLTATRPSRGGVAIDEAAHERLLSGLLAMDAAEGVAAPRRGPVTREARVARRENVRIATLIQMTMGLRIAEVRTLTWDRVREVQGIPSIAVPSEIAKNHTSRVVPFLDPRVIEVVEAHRQACGGVGYLIGGPADRTKLWDKDNCQKAIAELYKEWAVEYDIPELMTERSHVWRATLNTMYLGRVPEVARTAFFGHTAAVSREHYTDLGQVGPMLIEAQRRRTAGTH